jgi:hypothetical protein
MKMVTAKCIHPHWSGPKFPWSLLAGHVYVQHRQASLAVCWSRRCHALAVLSVTCRAAMDQVKESEQSRYKLPCSAVRWFQALELALPECHDQCTTACRSITIASGFLWVECSTPGALPRRRRNFFETPEPHETQVLDKEITIGRSEFCIR